MYEELLRNNRGLIAWAARRYIGAARRDGAVDVDDLMQAAFLGLIDASRTYDASKGETWSTWALRYIRKEIHALIGWRDGKFTKAHSGALSLDVPVSEDYEGTMLDALEDDTLDPVDAGAILDDDRRIVREAVADLKDDRQREVVERWQLGGETQAAVAESLGVSSERVRQFWKKAQKTLARDQRLRQLMYLEDCTPYYQRVTLARFNTTGTSQTERAVLWRIEHQPTPPPIAPRPPRDKRGTFEKNQ